MVEPRTAVVVSCYNQPRELALTLAALAAQTDGDFEVIVADDGSNPPAQELLPHLPAPGRTPPRAVWQPDRGFRKARVQNRAAIATGAELLVFLDSDCIPFRTLIETYRRRHRPGDFLVGGVGFLGAGISARLAPPDVWAGAHERALPRRGRLRLWNQHLRNLLRRGGKQTRPRIRGGNFGVCADLFRRVDGFDEVYTGFGREDSDLRNRMRNAGAVGRSLWPFAIAVHLDRSVSPSAERERVPPALYAEGRRRVTARVGLSSHR